MIYVGTWLKIIDNSGGNFGKCIRLYGKRKKVSVGSCLMIALKSIRLKRKVLKGKLYKAVVVQTNQRFFFLGGHYGKCDTNTIVLIKDDKEMIGTRINGLICHRLRYFGFLKLLSLSTLIY